jgi:hypothetical protein
MISAAGQVNHSYPAENDRVPAESPILDYQPPSAPGANPAALMLSNAIFVLTALAFVPLHAFVGRNIAIGLVSLIAFGIGGALALRSVIRSPRRQAMLSLSINALGSLFGAAYLIYYWRVLEPLSMLGK